MKRNYYCCRHCRLYVCRENESHHDYSGKHQDNVASNEFEDKFNEVEDGKIFVRIVKIKCREQILALIDKQQNIHLTILIEMKIQVKMKANLI